MQILFFIFRLYELIILARVVMSWVRIDPYHPVSVWIYRLTEPVLDPIRRLLPTARIGLDFSPLIVIVLIRLAEKILIRTLFSF